MQGLGADDASSLLFSRSAVNTSLVLMVDEQPVHRLRYFRNAFRSCAILNRQSVHEDYTFNKLSGETEELTWPSPGGFFGSLVLWRSDRIAAPRSRERE
jgi:hypothetical protein